MRLRLLRSPIFRRRTAASVLVTLVAVAALAGAPTARADPYDPDRAGHPLRILAYAVYPFGFAFEWLVMRPAHWVVNHEPFSSVFGHDDGRRHDGEERTRELED